MAGALDKATLADLPPFARELVELIGFGATLRLVELYPGIPCYVPYSADTDHPLVLGLGMRAAGALVKKYGGSTITVNNCKWTLVKIRHRAIREYRKEGFSQTKAARLFNLTPRQIRNIDSSLPKEETNLSLF